MLGADAHVEGWRGQIPVEVRDVGCGFGEIRRQGWLHVSDCSFWRWVR